MPKIETLLAQAGLVKDEPTGALSTPVYHSATFRHPKLGESTGYDYSRSANPTRKVLEEAVAALEGASTGLAFASGMAAVTAVVSSFASGDHFIVSDDLYGGTYRLFDAVFSRFGISASYVDTSDVDVVARAIKPSTKAFFIETPTNPVMKISDIRALCDLAKKRDIVTIIDNTFMSPYCQRPIELGADIVVHSATKYIGGHNDVVAGLVVTASRECGERLAFIQNSTGGVLSAQDSWLVLRGLKTLAVRMDRAQQNAEKIAHWLCSQEKVREVYYPGLKSHPGHKVHASQSSGFGAMISFRLTESSLVPQIINSVKLISFAESLGGVESLITYPCVQTHGAIPEELRKKAGVTEDLLRLSVGIENADDLIDDLDRAINGGAL